MNQLTLDLLKMTKLYEMERFPSEEAFTQAEEAITSAQKALELEVKELEKLQARKNGNVVEASFTAIELEKSLAEVSLLGQRVEKLYLELKEEKKPTKSKDDLSLELTRLKEEFETLEKEIEKQREEIDHEEKLLSTVVGDQNSCSIHYIRQLIDAVQYILAKEFASHCYKWIKGWKRGEAVPYICRFEEVEDFIRRSTEELEKTLAFLQKVKVEKWRVK